MANQTVNTRLQQKNDNQTDWETNNPVLLKGEMGVDFTNNQFKFGDGIKTWNEINTIFKPNRDFIEIPIDLSSEVTGILPIEMLDTSSFVSGDLDGIHKVQTVIPVSDVATLDLSMAGGNIFEITPTANTIISVINAVPDINTMKQFRVHINMGSTAYGITWFSGLTWLDDDIPTFNANKTGVCVFETVDGVSFVGNFSHEM